MKSGDSPCVWYLPLDHEKSKTTLGADLIDRGYQPVQIVIHNPTAHSFLFSPDHVSLPSSSGSKVAMSISKKAIPRSIGYKIAGFLFWPFMIPSTIDSIRTYSKHRALKKEFKAHSVKKEIVSPYSTIHRVLFVPLNEYNENFSLYIEDDANGSTTNFSSATN